jgi:nucleotide-binding universal stress UspA family protein
MIKRILVPVDFSPQSVLALDYAVELAKPLAAEIDVVHVVETVYFAAPGKASAIEAMVEAQQKIARTQLLQLERLYAKRRVGLRTSVAQGAPAQAIIDTAKRIDADLIVTATLGRSGVKHLLLGSVAERLVRTAPCPVLTVRAGATRPRRTARKR